jgi:glycosyltransferase involved in cell wall biosynthesis
MNRSVKITFVSNYINHHQIPFCEALYNREDCDFAFIQTEEMEKKRKDMGWDNGISDIPYVIRSYVDRMTAYNRIMDCDVLLIGWLNDESLVTDALEKARKNTGDDKLIIRISERLYREGQWRAISPKGLIRKYHDHIRYRNSHVYLLCNGAYVASDYSLIKAYPGKKFRFGYFPATRRYDNESLLFSKKSDLKTIEIESAEELPLQPPVLTDKEIEIVWAGRFMDLKHPEFMIILAEDLCIRGYRFHITMIGDGEKLKDLEKSASDRMVEEYITFTGMKSPEEVRDIMERSHIHIFTSDHLEGWGAVVNEGMNAGCAEVVSASAGASLFLVEDGQSGLIYRNDSYKEMLEKVLILLEDPKLIEQYGRAAYRRITGLWNAEVAADRLLSFYEGFLSGKQPEYEDGPFSVAPLIKPDFWERGRLGE